MIIKSVDTRRVLKSKIVKNAVGDLRSAMDLTALAKPQLDWEEKGEKGKREGGKRTGRKKGRVWDGVAQASVLQFVDPPVS